MRIGLRLYGLMNVGADQIIEHLPSLENRAMTDPDLSAVTVLLVEDNVHFRNLMRSILQALGVVAIEEARDGAEAIDLLKGAPVDLAIVDWKMDGINGVECVRLIRAEKDNPNRFLPIIMVTGYTENKLMRDARDAGVNDFLAKPISARSLLSRITEVLSGKRFFVESESFFGPDRRRREVKISGEDRRVSEAILIDPETPGKQSGK